MDKHPIEAEVESLAATVVDSALRVHRALGPGLLESAYEACLEHELRRRGIPVLRQVILPVSYEGIQVESGFRIDLLVGERLIVEVKSVEMIKKIHLAQVLTYLRLSGLRLGLLANFNVRLLKNGIRRVAL